MDWNKKKREKDIEGGQREKERERKGKIKENASPGCYSMLYS